MSTERHDAVMAMPEAVGRRPLAKHLASETTMGLEQVRAILASAHRDPVAMGQEALDSYRAAADPTGYRAAREDDVGQLERVQASLRGERTDVTIGPWGRQLTDAEMTAAAQDQSRAEARAKDLTAAWRRATNRT